MSKYKHLSAILHKLQNLAVLYLSQIHTDYNMGFTKGNDFRTEGRTIW